jgi:hypothetical protein
MWGWALNPSFASTPVRSTMRAKPAGVKGDPRSEVNTKGDFGSCSRCNLRRARISSPTTGWVAGVPFFAHLAVSVDVIPDGAGPDQGPDVERERGFNQSQAAGSLDTVTWGAFSFPTGADRSRRGKK